MMSLLRCLLMALSTLLLPSFCLAQQNDIKIIKERVVADLMTTKIDDSTVEAILARMNEDGSFKGINYDDLSRTASYPHGGHTRDLVYMAKAYKTKTSRYYRSKPLTAAIEKGLSFWVKHDFVGDNWHDNQITTPTNLGNLMLVIGDELPKDLVTKAQPMIGRANMNASGARPSGDRIVIAGILAKNLLFLGDYREFDTIIKIIEGELKFATGERGMQHDYSFHHRVDRVNNTSSYGYGKYANAYGEWSYYVSGTKYAFNKEKINQLVDYYLDGIYKQMVYGVYEDISVKNRSITHRAATQPQPYSTLEIERVLVSTDYRKNELEEIIRLRKGEAKPSASFAKFFWQTEHFVFQRPHFYTTVRMFSSRNRNMEEPYNGPGKTTHHRADGTNYLMLKGDEYHNIWAVYDWQKISGTTIVQKPQLPGPDAIQKDGLTDFVGAVTDGLYGAVVFDFKSPHDPLEAKKAWFFFDEEYVALGTDIKSKSNLPVATTLNQVLMRSDVHMMQDGTRQSVPKGSRPLQNVKWVHHDKVGYIFPQPASVHLSNQAETGRWSAITDQKNISNELVSEEVFSLWFDHGAKPGGASYQYIVVPNVTEQVLHETSQNNRSIEILSNTPALQAVKQGQLGIAQLAFHEAGAIDIEKGVNVRMDSPGMVMLKMQGGRLSELTLADPSRKLSRILLSVSGVYKAQGENFRTLVDENQKSTLFIVDLPQGVYLGKSAQLKIN
ncbi:polysaccharide lyase family 8 super-sandwich domain-containing protein [Telluribacter sp. SYSU D00476]|uniref:polysaccharide lyase family 8 super-sandwich domain-containing protein n=1 Tax=Telluribacter sp. SYSU D00476 TaxID=2811430 RepID=UPI001FF4EB84|nr:polysaccharide lyase family 8 super-sandwich domain-containing protein [Telluribacter sp. SYSU D00476]